MSTADDADDEKTLSGPPTPASARRASATTPRPASRPSAAAAAPAEPQPGHTLPLGTRLRDYEITGLIGEGGFGIVYLAWDHSLQRKVAIKEYMPASLAARVDGSSAIVVKSRAPSRHLPRRPDAASSTRRACSRASTIRRWSRSTASGRRTAPPTW